jgi:copper chaperone
MVESNFTVDGMSCNHCVTAVTEEVSKIAGVTGVDVDLSTAAVKVTSTEPLAEADMRAAIEEAGYALAS